MDPKKFKGFAPIYVISLSDRFDRRDYIKTHFSDHGVTNYKFFDAYDARRLNGTYVVSGGHIGCTLSHLSLIKEWYLTTDESHVIICEDDISLETSKYWSWSWSDFISSIKPNFDILHLSTSTFEFTMPEQISLVRKPVGETGLLTSCYIITRSGAKQVLEKTIGTDPDFSKILNFNDPWNMADHGVIYGSVKNYFLFPLFTPAPMYGSDTSTDDPDYIRFHNMNYEHAMWLWKYNQRSIKELTSYFE